MRIAIYSASSAVTRTLTDIVRASGHHLAADATDADLLLTDTQDASPTIKNRLILIAGQPTSDQEITYPCRPHQLIQRLMMATHTQTITLHNSWSLDLQARTLKHPEAPALTLTEKECTLLKTLIQATKLTREALLESVWGMAGDADTHTLETHIYRLRAKLAELTPPPGDIVTENSSYQWVTKS